MRWLPSQWYLVSTSPNPILIVWDIGLVVNGADCIYTFICIFSVCLTGMTMAGRKRKRNAQGEAS